MLFRISQCCCFFIILRFDRRFFLSADRLDILLDLLDIRWPSHRADACTSASFVHDIDGLVRQKTASNISIGKPNGCFQRLIGKLGFVMGLVLRAQTFQNLNRFFERWRVYGPTVPAICPPRLPEPTRRRWRSFQPLLHRAEPGYFWSAGTESESRVRFRSGDRSQDPARPSSLARSDRGRTRARPAS